MKAVNKEQEPQENSEERKNWVTLVDLVKRIVLSAVGVMLLVELFKARKMRWDLIILVIAVVIFYWLNLWFEKLKKIPLEAKSYLEGEMPEIKKIEQHHRQVSNELSQKIIHPQEPEEEKTIEIPSEPDFEVYRPNETELRELSEGEALMKAGDYEKALEIFDQLIAANAKDAQAWLKKGEALKKLGLDEEASQANFNAYMLGEKMEYD